MMRLGQPGVTLDSGKVHTLVLDILVQKELSDNKTFFIFHSF